MHQYFQDIQLIIGAKAFAYLAQDLTVSIRSQQPLRVSLRTEHQSKALVVGFRFSLSSYYLASSLSRTTPSGLRPTSSFNQI
jgi:hypothetical protein